MHFNISLMSLDIFLDSLQSHDLTAHCKIHMWVHFWSSLCLSWATFSAAGTTRHHDTDETEHSQFWSGLLFGSDTGQSEWSPGSNISLSGQSEQNRVSLLHARGRSSVVVSSPHGTRCIIDGWLIGNSITQRLLGWQTEGHRYPVRTIELEHRRGEKVSFRDASPLSADLLGTPNGHSLVHSLADDLPNGCSWTACWPNTAAQSRGENLIRG